jgi:ribosomal protein S18 acetylase RimI-like enzyme
VAVATIFVEGTTAGVYGLAVDASVRGNHFGAALLTACLRQSASWGCQAVVATAPRDETGTYRRLGFEEYEEIDCFALDPAQLGPLERDAV